LLLSHDPLLGYLIRAVAGWLDVRATGVYGGYIAV
jgi:hypothetical protein